EGRGGDLSAVLGPHAGWQFCPIDAERAALMVDQAARSEFGDREKARALQIGGLPALGTADRRHVGIEWQSRKVVAGQEAFRRKVPVGVEIRTAGRGPALQ